MQVVPSITQRCPSGQAAEETDPALVSISDHAKENTRAACVWTESFLPHPLSLPLGASAEQQLSPIFSVTC